jgi:hypothetical protein
MVATTATTRARVYNFIGIDLNVAGELEVRYQRYINITLLHDREAAAPSQSIPPLLASIHEEACLGTAEPVGITGTNTT